LLVSRLFEKKVSILFEYRFGKLFHSIFFKTDGSNLFEENAVDAVLAGSWRSGEADVPLVPGSWQYLLKTSTSPPVTR
jgi:hypothetical protein